MRTTVDDVKGVMNTALTDLEVSAFITLANNMVTSSLSGEGLSTTQLKDIETWLTAHLISVSKERQLSEERIDDIWIKYQGDYGGFLKSTTYGQMVLMLDTSGKLLEATKQKASIKATAQYSN